MSSPKDRLRRLVNRRKLTSGCNPPSISDFDFLCKTLLSIDPYLQASGIPIDDYLAFRPTIQSLTLLYLQDDVPFEKQNSKAVESIIETAAEDHAWLSNYPKYWPARLYLRRYWRNRQLHRTNSTRTTTRCGRPPHRVEPMGNSQRPPTQTKPYPPRDTSVNHQDAHTDITSSDLDDKNDSDDEYQRPQMSFFDRRVLHLRQKAPHTAHNDRTRDGASLAPLDDARTGPPESFPIQLPAGIPLGSGAGPSQETSKVNKSGRQVVKDFLRSLLPSLESHLEAFVTLGIRDRETLEAFLTFPSPAQSEFVDEGNGILHLTCLEKRGLLVGCKVYRERKIMQWT